MRNLFLIFLTIIFAACLSCSDDTEPSSDASTTEVSVQEASVQEASPTEASAVDAEVLVEAAPVDAEVPTDQGVDQTLSDSSSE